MLGWGIIIEQKLKQPEQCICYYVMTLFTGLATYIFSQFYYSFIVHAKII